MSKRDLKKLGLNIKYLRKEHGLSQEKFAEKISKCRNYIGLIERGEVNLCINTLFDIAKSLNVDIKKFFEFD